MADGDVVVFPDVFGDVFQLPLHSAFDEFSLTKVHNKAIVVELAQYKDEKVKVRLRTTKTN